jgi:hypothetical protein
VGIGPVMVTPFLQGDYLYGVDGKGELRCVELATGEQLWTTYAATTGGDRGAHSACAFLVKQGDRFFLASETGDLIIARLSPEGYPRSVERRSSSPQVWLSAGTYGGAIPHSPIAVSTLGTIRN